MKARALLMLAVAVGAVAACDSGSDDADPATTIGATSPPSVASSDPPTTTVEASTTSSTTTTMLPPTTLPAPTTTSPEQVKAEVAAAYLELDAKILPMLTSPSLDGLDARAAEVAVSGGPYYLDLVGRVTALVNNGQYAAPNTPDLRTVTVESVELTDGGAVVVACEVSNYLTMKGPDNSLTPGRPFVVGGSGELVAYRVTRDLQRTDGGWRHVGALQGETPYWPGESACPA